MNTRTRLAALYCLLAIEASTTGTSARAETPQKNAELNNAALSSALQTYLVQQGDFCLGKFDWPIDVSAHDITIHTNNAIQMPVLEKIGLVSSSDSTAIRKIDETDTTVPVRRYVLTAEGQKFYLQKPINSVSPSGEKISHRGDFCAGKLSLDKVISWSAPHDVGDSQETTINYTYKIAAADWTHNPQIRKAFPMLDRIVTGAGTLQLQQRARLTPSGWTAINLWE